MNYCNCLTTDVFGRCCAKMVIQIQQSGISVVGYRNGLPVLDENLGVENYPNLLDFVEISGEFKVDRCTAVKRMTSQV